METHVDAVTEKRRRRSWFTGASQINRCAKVVIVVNSTFSHDETATRAMRGSHHDVVRTLR